MKTKKKNFILVSTLLLIFSCSSSKKTSFTAEQKDEFHKLVQSKSFKITAKWANPLATQSMNAVANAGLLAPGNTINRIDLTGTASFLEVKGDSVSANLPYYGERQIAGAYNSSAIGIQFNGLAKDFKMSYNEKREAYEMQFLATHKTEVFNINAVLFINNAATIYVNSSQRLAINYQGTFKKQQDEVN